jgi:hypothetical protein
LQQSDGHKVEGVLVAIGDQDLLCGAVDAAGRRKVSGNCLAQWRIIGWIGVGHIRGCKTARMPCNQARPELAREHVESGHSHKRQAAQVFYR